jgi:hypothetical protein
MRSIDEGEGEVKFIPKVFMNFGLLVQVDVKGRFARRKSKRGR